MRACFNEKCELVLLRMSKEEPLKYIFLQLAQSRDKEIFLNKVKITEELVGWGIPY